MISMNKGLKISLVIFLIGLLAGTAAVLYMFNKPHRSIKETKPEYITEAYSINYEFSNQEEESNGKYANKIIQVTGNISELLIDGQRVSIIFSDGVSCELDSHSVSENMSLINDLKIDDQLTLKGQCDGYDRIMGVVLTRCFIIE